MLGFSKALSIFELSYKVIFQVMRHCFIEVGQNTVARGLRNSNVEIYISLYGAGCIICGSSFLSLFSDIPLFYQCLPPFC